MALRVQLPSVIEAEKLVLTMVFRMVLGCGETLWECFFFNCPDRGRRHLRQHKPERRDGSVSRQSGQVRQHLYRGAHSERGISLAASRNVSY